MRFFLISILLFILVELALLIWIGNLIGIFSVLFLVILTSVLGVLFGRKESIDTWNRALNTMARREVPAFEMINGICILLGAALLVAPGFISDILGFLLLIPFTRKRLMRIVAKILDKMVGKGIIVYRRF